MISAGTAELRHDAEVIGLLITAIIASRPAISGVQAEPALAAIPEKTPS